MSQKLKDIPLINRKRYYEIFIANDRNFNLMWAQHHISTNTMKAIERRELQEFIKEKEKELEKIRRGK